MLFQIFPNIRFFLKIYIVKEYNLYVIYNHNFNYLLNNGGYANVICRATIKII